MLKNNVKQFKTQTTHFNTHTTVQHSSRRKSSSHFDITRLQLFPCFLKLPRFDFCEGVKLVTHCGVSHYLLFLLLLFLASSNQGPAL